MIYYISIPGRYICVRHISFLVIMLLNVAFAVNAAPEVTFSGNTQKVIDIIPDRNTGLDHIYVARTLRGVSISAPALNGQPLTSWQAYRNNGGGYATDVNGLRYEGTTAILDTPEGDTGYILRWPDATLYFWLTDYSDHELYMQSIQLPEEEDCGITNITIHGIGDAIYYYTINGRQLTLSRNIKVSYHTLNWDEEQLQFTQIESAKEIENIGNLYISPAPLCNTSFTASGDRFLEEWGTPQQISSSLWTTNAVEVHTTARRTNSVGENSNQIGAGQNADELGGSAPADVSFNAYISDAVRHCEWQFATDPNFDNITHRFTQQDLDYTFRDEGTVYVRFIGSNNDGSCTSEGDIYTVSIGASELRCPNAFSPGTTEGINDEWKVSYRSLVEFKCWIFDRNGTQLFYFDDPEMGWDGKYNGKLVRPGVYFYVIEAKGADGKSYKKGGDINILRYKPNSTN